MSTQPDASHNFSERFLARKIIVAKIGRPHGVRGWASLISYTDPADNVVEFDQYWLGEADAWTQIDPPKFSFKGDKLLIKMPDVDTPEIVRERLLHQLIAVERRQLPLPEEGAYYMKKIPDEKQIKRLQAIIRSMTPMERELIDIVKGSRLKRVATGSGVLPQDVKQLLRQYKQMSKMMKMFQGNKMAKMMKQFGRMSGGDGNPFGG